MFFGKNKIIAPDSIVVEAEVASDNLGANIFLEVKDAQRRTGRILNITPSGDIVSSGLTIGVVNERVRYDKWTHIAVVLDNINHKKTIYINGNKKEDKMEFESIGSITDIRFYATKNYSGELFIDDFKIYKGTIPRAIPENEPGPIPNQGATYFRNDFDDIKFPYKGENSDSKSNSFTIQTEELPDGRKNRYLYIESADPVQDDCYFGYRGVPAKKLLFGMSLARGEKTAYANIEIKDVDRNTGYLYYIKKRRSYIFSRNRNRCSRSSARLDTYCSLG